MPYIEHNFQTHGPKAYYNPQGEPRWCHHKDDVAKAKQDGFTSANYVPSFWPKCAYNKKTGLTRSVGRLEWSQEQNEAAVVSLGPDWGLDHVPVPEPVAEVKAAAPDTTGLMTQMLAALNASNERMAALEAAAVESDDKRAALETQLAEMQAKMVTPPAKPTPAVKPAADAPPAK